MCIQTNRTTSNIFVTDEIHSEKTNGTKKFLGIIEKRYVRSFHGIVHGLASTMTLILGNFVFANRVFLGNQGPIHGNTTNLVFHACNFLASATTLIFFWNKVQSWQLSSTTMAEKGLTPRILQRLNQGRGVITMLIYSLFPLACSAAPQYMLENKTFSWGLALSLIGGSAYVFDLIRDYGKHLWVVYGWYPMAMGISILSSADGTVASILENSPLAVDRFQKDASFVICCVQLGFMMYYFYSRKLVTEEQVREICQKYHVTLVLLYLYRVERDLFAYATSKSTSSIPLVFLIQPMLLNTLVLKLVVAVGSKVRALASEQTEHMELAAVENVPSTVVQSRSNSFVSPKGQRRRRGNRLAKRISNQ